MPIQPNNQQTIVIIIIISFKTHIYVNEHQTRLSTSHCFLSFKVKQLIIITDQEDFGGIYIYSPADYVFILCRTVAERKDQPRADLYRELYTEHAPHQQSHLDASIIILILVT